MSKEWSGWRGIESAPRDGSTVLVFGRGPRNPDAFTFDDQKEKLIGTYRTLYWFDGYDQDDLIEVEPGLFRKEPVKRLAGWRGTGTWLFKPTHWRPLPEPPEAR